MRRWRQWGTLCLGAGLWVVLGCGSGAPGGSNLGGELPPVAAISVSVSRGTAPLTVGFKNASTGTIQSCQWQFGDGSESTLNDPTHVFSQTGTFAVQLRVTGPGGSATATSEIQVEAAPSGSWRFAVVGDTHVPDGVILSEMVPDLLTSGVDLVVFPGDIVQAGAGASPATFRAELEAWKTAVAPLKSAGLGVYAMRGNHEADVKNGLPVWLEAFSGGDAFPQNGPAGELWLTYGWTHRNARFLALDQYVDPHRVNQAWVSSQLGWDGDHPHTFVFGHEPAFKAFHEDCLGQEPAARDTFWDSLARANVRLYFCGHDHFFNLAQIEDGDDRSSNDLLQVVVGTGGGTLFSRHGFNGDNGNHTPREMAHAEAHGFLIVEVGGADGLELTLTFRQRTLHPDGKVTFDPAYTSKVSAVVRSYPIVDTGQTACFDNWKEISPPLPGEPFFGQDAQHEGQKPSYRDNGDGTISDLQTGLMWVKERGVKLSWNEAESGAKTCRVGGYSDWRMPTVKELYSLILFSGAQGSSLTSLEGYLPFIDTQVFDFAYGSGLGGERVIDCQDWSSTRYVGQVMGGQDAAFGVNFADGRIKGYPSGRGSLYVRYVRGNPFYGINAYQDQGDGTVTDAATGLMWDQGDSGQGLDWQEALAWVEARNAQHHKGYSDWRLPNAKELQSLVDYGRAPLALDTTARGPALNPVFQITPIQGEDGREDYPFFWTSTSFKDGTPNGVPAAYISFGRALGHMRQGGSGPFECLDVHGAGAQRSDPKSGNVSDYLLGTDAHGQPVYGRGPQGDVVRIKNFVRLVRDV